MALWVVFTVLVAIFNVVLSEEKVFKDSCISIPYENVDSFLGSALGSSFRSTHSVLRASRFRRSRPASASRFLTETYVANSLKITTDHSIPEAGLSTIKACISIDFPISGFNIRFMFSGSVLMYSWIALMFLIAC